MKDIWKGKWNYGLDFYFFWVNVLVFVSVSIISTCVSALLYHFFHLTIRLPEAVYSVTICIMLGIVVTVFLTKKISVPINKLQRAMNQVAQRNFTVRIESDSKLNEVQKLYYNFNLMVEELAATETLQSDFVSNVSHEFKTPINAIDGYATLLQGTQGLTLEQEEYVNKILHNTERLSGLVSNILLLSKIENQVIPAKREKFPLDEQIRQAIVALETKWSEKKIELEADLEQVSYIGNEALLLHIWINLIDNAIKFNPVGGKILVCLKASEQNILVAVSDSGCGISQADKKRIFDKFYQADPSRKGEGNGLGLALAYRIAVVHNGYIEAENGAQGGARFTVVLPVLQKNGE
ncbi:MAG: ATP-binding protein [Monoglobales bacterium]